MDVWIYCIVKEEYSCKELGLLRQRCMDFAHKRRMKVIGVSSVNAFDGDYHCSSTLDEAINSKINVLIIANIHLVPYYKRNLINDLCRKNGITIIPYAVYKDRD